ncbi:class I SAM-dependent RNA methyltransferase [Acetobacter sp.]|jgi:23S rRNA (uracil1939-C5)-methyltransferase|uniref:class I SAM-dependent RNA methyltransferase n=1 Tax=Acetobacter sp. TaxID=440 RepID=UPI0025B82A48|nr:class I SAM-dependent RNA methyltransferase [Acetobacter sp.]MCH4091275.1 class I SAM-dependent RNA methyltransferase [Acetobacter sp.]MCI1300830.1 class I SAM-dependent RNA methyltransferase [Acetobacter sp.]MCI1317158.1 class I SAM-dependent RNA methyltransferase [Acetobacter sp.]
MARKAEGRGRRRPHSHQSPSPAIDPTPRRYRIEALGVSGDGIGRPADSGAQQAAPVFIPYTAPGDEVLARSVGKDRASVLEICVSAPERVTPPCSLFGTCGGCSLQHLSAAWILEWKTAEVVTGLRRAGAIDLPPVSSFQTPPATRRRVDLAARRRHDSVILGLHRRGGDVVDLTECSLLHPDIVSLLPALRTMLERLDLFRREADLLINLLDSGPDLLLASDAQPSTADRIKLAAFCKTHRISRLCWKGKASQENPETLVQLAPSVITFDGVVTEPPSGAFLQASREGEVAIRTAVLAALPPSRGRRSTIVELYAGCGTLTFGLAGHARVDAYEGHPDAVETLARAAAGKNVTAHRRDLNRQPVEAKELTSSLAVVLDPPHSGAGLQMNVILEAKPGVVIYVSCNPRTLYRDAAHLLQAGYRIDALTVIDQFLWSAETEIVCRFSYGVH